MNSGLTNAITYHSSWHILGIQQKLVTCTPFAASSLNSTQTQILYFAPISLIFPLQCSVRVII